ncbi:hypothetical protein DW322_04970 [Rhodococcus rhodnii]|uniref:Uncharacterized protein n=2 Tax=Rhodococcus rhodnii TaxID=38312 RepID=R7WH93_9NOCA|nr:hypothetical protein [Rhodococcus rhodnii]EOM74525.1 hypothetical protein Rrhod_4114 [Rhodococcus rhodnii LMG 5362]TXG89689.1 hypothetical protein DW322_04970 [Rhodococcus rhodnii]
MTGAVAAVAMADFRDRSRRPAFLVTVLGAVALGYVAVPPVSATYAMVKVGSFRGLYDSAYIGMLLAMIGSLWLPLFGFYVVRGRIARDISTGVGEMLSASPLRTPMYLVGKYLSNLMVLAAMAAALALIAPVMQLLRGESTSLDLTTLWLPLVLFCLPVLAVAAAAAVVFETVPFLRGGAGNILWFFVYPSMFLAGIPLVYGSVTAGFQADLAAQHPGTDDEISIGLTAEPGALGQFTWSGIDIDTTLVAASAGLIAAATLVAFLPSLWFGRFDPSRRQRTPSHPSAVPATEPPVAPAFSQGPRTLPPGERGQSFPGLLLGEVRIHLGSVSRWWWLTLAIVTIAALAVPADRVGTVLLFAWLLPVLVWSRLGTLTFEQGVAPLVQCSVSPRIRLVAEWGAGVLIAAIAGVGPLVKMLLAADATGVAAWVAGATAIPALALLIGSIGRSARVFQAVYLVIWYAVLNGVAAVDVMGALRTDESLAGPPPLLSFGVGAALIAATALVQEIRHARR